MVRNTAVSGNDGRGRFARPPWTKKSSEWRRIDARIADGHLAQHVNQAVELLDLTPLFDSYLGVGKEAIRPDLLLKLVLYLDCFRFVSYLSSMEPIVYTASNDRRPRARCA